MARQAIFLLLALDVALVIWGQQTFPPEIPTFPPPPTATAVINQSVVVFVGEPIIVNTEVQVTINCSPLIDEAIANGIPNPTVRWIKDGLELSNGSATNVEISADRRLVLISATAVSVGGQLGNDGSYTCDVCTDFMSPNCRNTTELPICNEPHLVPSTGTALVFPTFIALTCGQDATTGAIVGASITIQCMQFNGTDVVTEVYKDGEFISNTFPHMIAPASDDDFGTYTFAVSNDCGRDVAVSRINRQADPPDIDEGPFIPQPPAVIPGDMTVMIGTPTYVVDGFDVTLVCNIASGTRPITIMWIRNGAPYPAGGNRSTITIPDTDYNDGDVFACRADNIVGFDEENTTINVFEPPQILPIPFPTPPPGDPDITVSTGQPMNTSVTTGSSVTIYCPSSGIDTPGIEWFRNGMMVVAGGRFTISTTTLPGAVITSVLTIDDFQPSSDAGTYTCSSTNIVGSDDGSTTLLGDICPVCPPDALETAVPDSCPVCGVWRTDMFGRCSLECHLGIMTRNVFCVNVADGDRVVSNTFCDSATMPAGSQSCGSGPCATGWRRGPWTKCSRTCHAGHQMRMVVCTQTGVVVPDEECEESLRPRSTRFCNGHIDCFPCKDEYPDHCRRLMQIPMGCMGDYARKLCCWSCRND